MQTWALFASRLGFFTLVASPSAVTVRGSMITEPSSRNDDLDKHKFSAEPTSSAPRHEMFRSKVLHFSVREPWKNYRKSRSTQFLQSDRPRGFYPKFRELARQDPLEKQSTNFLQSHEFNGFNHKHGKEDLDDGDLKAAAAVLAPLKDLFSGSFRELAGPDVLKKQNTSHSTNFLQSHEFIGFSHNHGKEDLDDGDLKAAAAALAPLKDLFSGRFRELAEPDVLKKQITSHSTSFLQSHEFIGFSHKHGKEDLDDGGLKAAAAVLAPLKDLFSGRFREPVEPYVLKKQNLSHSTNFLQSHEFIGFNHKHGKEDLDDGDLKAAAAVLAPLKDLFSGSFRELAGPDVLKKQNTSHSTNFLQSHEFNGFNHKHGKEDLDDGDLKAAAAVLAPLKDLFDGRFRELAGQDALKKHNLSQSTNFLQSHEFIGFIGSKHKHGKEDLDDGDLKAAAAVLAPLKDLFSGSFRELAGPDVLKKQNTSHGTSFLQSHEFNGFNHNHGKEDLDDGDLKAAAAVLAPLKDLFDGRFRELAVQDALKKQNLSQSTSFLQSHEFIGFNHKHGKEDLDDGDLKAAAAVLAPLKDLFSGSFREPVEPDVLKKQNLSHSTNFLQSHEFIGFNHNHGKEDLDDGDLKAAAAVLAPLKDLFDGRFRELAEPDALNKQNTSHSTNFVQSHGFEGFNYKHGKEDLDDGDLKAAAAVLAPLKGLFSGKFHELAEPDALKSQDKPRSTNFFQSHDLNGFNHNHGKEDLDDGDLKAAAAALAPLKDLFSGRFRELAEQAPVEKRKMSQSTHFLQSSDRLDPQGTVWRRMQLAK